MKRDLIEKALKLIQLFESGRHLTRTTIGKALGISPQAAGRWITEVSFVLPIAEYCKQGKCGRPENIYYLESNCTVK
jgi:response regulator of citrate/malate metabolism